MNKCFCSIGEELSKDIPYKSNSFLSNQVHPPDRNCMEIASSAAGFMGKLPICSPLNLGLYKGRA